jgi:adenine-specific DNA-methyltransferase
MKYMGSKRAMLRNGLGQLIEREVETAERFVDLFTGSAAVARHVAQHYPVPVVAYDLQEYSVALANAVIARRRKLPTKAIWGEWYKRASRRTKELKDTPQLGSNLSRSFVAMSRGWCSRQQRWPITTAYGGHYFSPQQAVWIDALRATLPSRGAGRRAALAALIQAVSQCVAGPGHTAQPFQATRTGMPHLFEAWSRDVVGRTKRYFELLASLSALKRGLAKREDANIVAKSIRRSDLVFVDPPYSGVHYSRFYHVLESVARGKCGNVTGTGRYPEPMFRPRSRYSLKTESRSALDNLLETIASRGAKVILTFPNHQCSNGLSGAAVRLIALRHFDVEESVVASRFSTLGGTSDRRENEAGRAARQDARELLLSLKPKSRNSLSSSQVCKGLSSLA